MQWHYVRIGIFLRGGSYSVVILRYLSMHAKESRIMQRKKLYCCSAICLYYLQRWLHISCFRNSNWNTWICYYCNNVIPKTDLEKWHERNGMSTCNCWSFKLVSLALQKWYKILCEKLQVLRNCMPQRVIIARKDLTCQEWQDILGDICSLDN